MTEHSYNYGNQSKQHLSAAAMLEETMAYYQITQQDLAERIGVTQKHVSEVLNYKAYLTPQLAFRVERVTGLSARTLLNLDYQYRLQLASQSVKQEVPGENNLFLHPYEWSTFQE